MNFRTQVELPEKQTEIRHSDQLMFFGSCFAENIAHLLEEHKFRCDVNPFGVLYNPLSINRALLRILEGKCYTEDELFSSHGLWHSWMHHSDFSASSVEECLGRINARMGKASDGLRKADWLVMTWGTAYVYVHEESGEVVGNCHKMPDKTFRRLRSNVEAFVEECRSVLEKCRKVNPKLKVLLTVSPIRHAKDGMHANQLSKATLLLAAEELCRTCPDCFYFPSYEIVMDELRDYRFYADDMVHPSPLAIDYIWQRFSEYAFNTTTRQLIEQIARITQAAEHKPFEPTSEAHKRFCRQKLSQIEELNRAYPTLDFGKEIEAFCKYL